MKPSLETILRAVLKAQKMPYSDWEILKYTRTHNVAMVVQLVSIIANKFGYRSLQTAAFLGRSDSAIRNAIKHAKDLADVYPDIKATIEGISERLAYEYSHTCYGFIARSKSGLLTLSYRMPERSGHYWIAEGMKPYVNQRAFPQITWKDEPIKVKIKITIEDEEV